jgi:hypothetical protein
LHSLFSTSLAKLKSKKVFLQREKRREEKRREEKRERENSSFSFWQIFLGQSFCLSFCTLFRLLVLLNSKNEEAFLEREIRESVFEREREEEVGAAAARKMPWKQTRFAVCSSETSASVVSGTLFV